MTCTATIHWLTGTRCLFAGVTDLPTDLQRHFQGLRDLDVRVTKLQQQVDEDCIAQLKEAAENQACPAAKKQKVSGPAMLESELAQRIEHNMNEIIKLSEEKMNRAQQIYDYIDQHIRKLDKEMKSFEADVTKERQRLGLPPLSEAGADGSVPVDGRRKRGHKAVAVAAPEPAAQPTSEEYQAAVAAADRIEPTYCYCKRISFGHMIACEHPECPVEWFHFECVGLTPENRPKGES